MNGSSNFFTTLVTALVVSLLVTGAYHVVVVARPASAPEPAAELEPVKAQAVDMPNLAGLTVADARAQLEKLGLTVAVEKAESDTVAVDHVISSKPARFETVKAGAAVVIHASIGSPMVEVPKVRRMPPRKARKILEEAGFVVEVKNILNEDFSFDRVIRQEPKEGEQAKKGSTVVITVNTEDAYE